MLWSDHSQNVKVLPREIKKNDLTHILSQLWQLDTILKHEQKHSNKINTQNFICIAKYCGLGGYWVLNNVLQSNSTTEGDRIKKKRLKPKLLQSSSRHRKTYKTSLTPFLCPLKAAGLSLFWTGPMMQEPMMSKLNYTVLLRDSGIWHKWVPSAQSHNIPSWSLYLMAKTSQPILLRVLTQLRFISTIPTHILYKHVLFCSLIDD